MTSTTSRKFSFLVEKSYNKTVIDFNSSFAIILMGTRELVALLSLSSWCLMIVARLFLAVPWVCLPFLIVVFPDHTHLLYLQYAKTYWVPQMSFEQS